MSTDIEKLNNIPATRNITSDIRHILAEARNLSVRAVNSAMVAAYWLIGRRIALEEQGGAERAEYGEEILKKLSKELETEFGNGFSYSNLKNMRQFYKTYPDEIGYTLCSQLSWKAEVRTKKSR